MQKITPCLWFNFNAEEAVNFYIGLFPDSRIDFISYYGDEIPQHTGKVLMIEFTLAGQSYLALNAGPNFKFNEAISMSVNCADQAEVDRLWNALIDDGGAPADCSWLKDKFGLSWQIVPQVMRDILHSPDKAALSRGFSAMLTMQKLDVAVLEKALRGH